MSNEDKELKNTGSFASENFIMLKTLSDSWPTIFIVSATSLFCVGYALLQKKFFSRNATQVLTRFYFPLTWPINYFTRKYLKKGDYWSRIDEFLILGAVPFEGWFFSHVTELYKSGVRGVISLQDEYAGPVEAYERLGMNYLRLPVIDHEEPTLGDLKEAVIFLYDHDSNGLGKVYCHCKGGHGRAAAVAFCWLLYKQNVTPEAVQKQLLTARHVRKHLYKQETILQFYDQLKKGWKPHMGIGWYVGEEDGDENEKSTKQEAVV